MKEQVIQQLRLVDGKFMRGDVEEPVQIGNTEQIALLRKAEREMTKQEQDAKAGKLDVEISVENIKYDVICEFTCTCGNKIIARGVNYTDVREDLEAPNYEDGPIICDKCDREYDINGLYAILINK